ncbi:DUF4249 domain-containing protein [Flavobacterium sp.]|jgi:hypothetical protein|uniref:DUF4249 domain-containing protein n=2 Tax=Flavobacterium sp. TaxID=239 RepID=UPI00391DF58D
MKLTTTICLLVATATLFTSCEKEINLDLKNTSPKLVVEGNILWGIDTVINQQELKLSLSANYTGNTNPLPVTNAIVMVNDGTNNYTYNHIGNGVYSSNFIAATNKTYKLIISYEGDEYNAYETLKAGGAAIDSLTVNYFPSALGSPEGNFITVNTTDPLNERNFYLWQLFINEQLMINPSPGNIYRAIQKDDFFNGQPLLNYLPFDNFPVVTGDIARLHQLNISEQMYNYYYSIFNLTASSPVSGDVPPGNIKGNIVNLNKPDKNALGYFGACSISIKTKSI